MKNNKPGWSVAQLSEIGPRKDNWPLSIRSIGYHMGITSFGVNGKSVDKDESLTPEHTEVDSKQEELFIIISGSAEFRLDGKTQVLKTGSLLAIEPQVMRSAKALEDNTTMLIIGGQPGKAFNPSWLD